MQYPNANTNTAPQQINPRFFGAYGDNATDDTSYFKNAIEALPENGVFYIPLGSYAICSPLAINKKGVTITGEGTLVYCFPRTPPNPNLVIKPNENNNTFRCESCNNESLFVVTAENVTIRGIRMVNCYHVEGAQAVLALSSGFSIESCVIEEMSQGIMVGGIGYCKPTTSPTNIKITNNKILNVRGLRLGSICYGDGVICFGCSGVTISNNTITAALDCSPRNGVNCGPEGSFPQQDIIISNNQLEGPWDYPITTEGCRRSVITSNTVKCECIAAIIERGEDITVSNNSIHVIPRGSRYQSENTVGIQFFGVRNGCIVGNTISGMGKTAIMCTPSYSNHEGWGNNVVINGNTLTGEFFYGIFLANKMTKVMAYSNNINMVHKDPNSIGFHVWNSDNCTCTSNIIETKNGHAMVLSGCTGIKVSENNICDSRVGIYMNRESSNVMVTNNCFDRIATKKIDYTQDIKNLFQNGNFGLNEQPPFPPQM